MKLISLRVEQFRRFRQPVEVRNLQSGINLFTGPNESGKSTLVRAIRAAFFERFKSNSVDDLQPWGDTAASPSVELEFEWLGERWHLNKSFLRHKRCDLQIGNRAFNGEEAEEQLSTLMGYAFPGRGASRAENWGIPGLLWVEQGAGQELNEAVSYAGEHLKSALGGSLGELASSSGDELINVLERERNKLRTAGTGRPTGDLARANEHAQELQQRLRELQEKGAAYRQQVDRLGSLLGEREQDQERPWEAFRHQAQEAQQRLNEVQGWLLEQNREQKSLQQMEQNHELCQQHLQASVRLQESLIQRQQAVDKSNQTVQGKQAEEKPLQGQLEMARDACQLAREQLSVARRQSQRRSLLAELNALEQSLTEAGQKLEQASEYQRQLLQVREQQKTLVLDEAQFNRLRQVVSELERVQISREAVATRLRYELLPGQSIKLGEETLSGVAERLLLSPVSIDIQGVGRLQISPGGEDLVELDLRQQQLQDEQSSLCGLMRVASLADAEVRAEQGSRLAEDIARLGLRFEQVAPDGTSPLSDMLALGVVSRSTLLQQIELIPEELLEPGLTLEQAEERQLRAMAVLNDADRAVSDHRVEASSCLQKLQSAQEELKRLQDEIHAPDRLEREQQLRSQLVQLQADQLRVKQDIALRQQQIDSARPDILEQDVQRLTDTASALEVAAGQRNLEIARLQSSLEALGAQGLDEELSALEQELDAVQRRQAELVRRADALELLLRMLKTKRHALTQRLQEPLQRHLNSYLQLLFPQAQLSVDDQLIPTQLVRMVNGVAEYGEVDALSFGSREQMGLISRLAYADLLQEAGRPTLIILDDALVHSDQDRLAQMKRVLFDAAQRHQILLFTCHPEHWRDLGVVPRDIQTLKIVD